MDAGTRPRPPRLRPAHLHAQLARQRLQRLPPHQPRGHLALAGGVPPLPRPQGAHRHAVGGDSGCPPGSLPGPRRLLLSIRCCFIVIDSTEVSVLVEVRYSMVGFGMRVRPIDVDDATRRVLNSAIAQRTGSQPRLDIGRRKTAVHHAGGSESLAGVAVDCPPPKHQSCSAMARQRLPEVRPSVQATDVPDLVGDFLESCLPGGLPVGEAG